MLDCAEQENYYCSILRGISPQHRAEYLDGFFALPVIRPGADVADVWAELVDDLLDVLKLLWGKVGVVEQPIKFFAVFVFGAHEIHSAVYKAEHFMTLLDALRLMLQLRAGEIRAGQIDGFQKILNRLAVVDPEPIPNLTHGNLQTPDNVAVFPQQCPGIVIMRIFGHICCGQLILRHCRSLLSAGS